MKYIPAYLILAITLLCCTPTLRADETSKSAKAAELLKLVQGDQFIKAMEPMMKGILAQANVDMTADQRAKLSEMQQKMMTLVGEHFNKALPTLAKVYTDTYTEEELDAILAFYKSTAGKSFLQKMPEVMQRSVPVMMQIMSDLQPEMKSMMEEFMGKAKH